MSFDIDIKKKLSNFTLEIALRADSETIGLLGASGCGKSMTLKCIAGIEKPDEGKISIDGKTVFDSAAGINVPPQERHAGYLFQNYALFPTMTVEDNIGVVIRNADKSKRKKIASEMISRLGLQGLERSKPSRLSGGQQQRVALARMLVSSPSIIMLDEPFSALDSFLRAQIERELLESLNSFRGSIIFVSHNRDETYRISDRIAVMNRGKIESAGSRDAIFENPETVTAARLTGCKNIAKAIRMGESSISVPDWGLVLETGRAITDDIGHVGIRAHHIRAARDNDETNCFSFFIEQKSLSPFSVSEYITVEENNLQASSHFPLTSLWRERSQDEWPNQNEMSYNYDQKGSVKIAKLCIPPEKLLLLRD
jgi:molybdate transport system ATP-binding protein